MYTRHLKRNGVVHTEWFKVTRQYFENIVKVKIRMKPSHNQKRRYGDIPFELIFKYAIKLINSNPQLRTFEFLQCVNWTLDNTDCKLPWIHNSWAVLQLDLKPFTWIGKYFVYGFYVSNVFHKSLAFNEQNS